MRVFVGVAFLLASTPVLAHSEGPAAATAITKPTPPAKPVSTSIVGHSGGTDANGCHVNHTTGLYHCHTPK